MSELVFWEPSLLFSLRKLEEQSKIPMLVYEYSWQWTWFLEEEGEKIHLKQMYLKLNKSSQGFA